MGGHLSQPAFRGHKAVLRDLCMLNADTLVTASIDRKVKLWDVRTRRCKMTLDQGRPAQSVCVANDHTIVAGASNGMVRVWDTTEGVCRVAVQAHEYHAHALTMLDATRFASCGLDCRMGVWKLETCELVHAMPVTKYPGHALCTLKCGLLVGSTDTVLMQWDVSTLEEVARYPALRGTIMDMEAVSATEFLACARGGLVQLWDARTCTSVRSFEGFTLSACGVCKLGEHLVASGGDDCEVRVWDMRTGACLLVEDWPKRTSKPGYSKYVHAVGALSSTSLAYSMNGVGPVNVLDVGRL